jgi:hypothetical protein
MLPGTVEQEMKMAKMRLLQAVCTVSMLAAVPAMAQRPEAGMTGPNGAPNPAAQQPAGNSDMGQADNTGSAGNATSGASTSGQSTHRSAMAHRTGMTHGRTDNSQNAAVDQLNEQSYQAAQQGQAFSANGTAPSPAPAASAPMGGSGSMNNMGSSGSTSMGGSPSDGGAAGAGAAGAGAAAGSGGPR